MVNYVNFLLLTVLTSFNICFVSVTLSSPPHSVSTAMVRITSPPEPLWTAIAVIPSPPEPPSVNDFIGALHRQGGFSIWSSLLTAYPTSPVLPMKATLFVPMNSAVPHLNYENVDPLLVPYHIIPQRLSYQDLRLLKPFTRLPTLVPSKTVLIANTSTFNFTIQDSIIIHPNLYLASQVAVHGINRLLNYTLYD